MRIPAALLMLTLTLTMVAWAVASPVKPGPDADPTEVLDQALKGSGQVYFQAKSWLVEHAGKLEKSEMLQPKPNDPLERQMLLMAIDNQINQPKSLWLAIESLALNTDGQSGISIKLNQAYRELWLSNPSKLDEQSEAALIFHQLTQHPDLLYEILLKHNAQTWLDVLAPVLLDYNKKNDRRSPEAAGNMNIEQWKAMAAENSEQYLYEARQLAIRALVFKPSTSGIAIIEQAGLSDDPGTVEAALTALRQINSEDATNAARKVQAHYEEVLAKHRAQGE